jgi:hypothetical protein
MRLAYQRLLALMLSAPFAAACSKTESPPAPTGLATPGPSAPAAPATQELAPEVAEQAPSGLLAPGPAAPPEPVAPAPAGPAGPVALRVGMFKRMAEHRGDCGGILAALRPFLAENGAALKALNTRLAHQDQVVIAELTRGAAELAPFSDALAAAAETCATNPEFARMLQSIQPDVVPPPATPASPPAEGAPTPGAPPRP